MRHYRAAPAVDIVDNIELLSAMHRQPEVARLVRQWFDGMEAGGQTCLGCGVVLNDTIPPAR